MPFLMRWSSSLWKSSMLRESALSSQCDLNSQKRKPLVKHWNVSNLLTVLLIPCFFFSVYSCSKSGIITAWNLWHFFWIAKPVEMMVLAIDWGEFGSILLVPLIMKIYFTFKLDEK